MRFQKWSLGEEGWEDITREQVLEYLAGSYIDTELAISSIENMPGLEIRTTFSLVRFWPFDDPQPILRCCCVYCKEVFDSPYNLARHVCEDALR